MDKKSSNKARLTDVSFCGTNNTPAKFLVTKNNSLVVHKFAKLSIEKASYKIDRKVLENFTDYIQLC